MKTVRVKASREYDIIIGSNIELPKASSPGRRLALISDDRVWELYGKETEAKLKNCGYQAISYTFPHGEASKNIAELSRILEFLAAEKLTRTDMIAALGGGVTGDMAGFAAAVYLRGIEFIQLPTTLLAAVDSSVGGKTAIDLKAGKNLAGAFWQPSGVYCDCNTFKTLEPEIWADGMAEAIKYGMILDRKLFERFEKGFSEAEYPDMIAACVGIKRDIVEEDEKDTGKRQLLNFGHTLGHGIEKCSGYRVSHGRAVAIGMVLAAKLAEKIGFAEEACSKRLEALLLKNNLPVSTNIPVEELVKAAAVDKKRKGDRITLILPKRIGDCRLYDINIEELEDLLQ